MSKERPILFNAAMVRALLNGRKTQTRRIVKTCRERGMQGPVVRGQKGEVATVGFAAAAGLCPYGQPGDRLWVREATSEDCTGSVSFARYKADGAMVRENGNCLSAWWYSRPSCPSIHMPRWASRITLEIVSVRVERLQDISNEDAVAEGIGTPLDARYAALDEFKPLWESINGAGSWAANPWVWVIEFKHLEASQ
ncbi:hypothetical protein HHSLTHF2_06470 [Vreelandella venusta]|uniref:Morphogenetic protein n=1 Tax=Halomonas hydrothermalis TaxID=115561 RepID=A0A6F8TZD9_9GAMM|nr:hypothetical protein [Halomonas hydrothermalis]BCB06757.1 hypothetical protein HHSLTHF2_06470 [Halomonas hydrothermalis]